MANWGRGVENQLRGCLKERTGGASRLKTNAAGNWCDAEWGMDGVRPSLAGAAGYECDRRGGGRIPTVEEGMR